MALGTKAAEEGPGAAGATEVHPGIPKGSSRSRLHPDQSTLTGKTTKTHEVSASFPVYICIYCEHVTFEFCCMEKYRGTRSYFKLGSRQGSSTLQAQTYPMLAAQQNTRG